jgi:maltose 6'-phosphate phosphatase
MRSFIRIRKLVVGGFGGLLLLALNCSWAWAGAQCFDVSGRGHLRVLTLNLLFSEIEQREIRLERIVDFIAQEAEPIDVILTQEVVGGALAKTVNSSLDLKRLLSDRGLDYNLNYTMANGIPGLLSVGNSILSRCEVAFTLSKTLPFESEVAFDNFEIPLKRKVIMARIDVPHFGKIDVYDTHLCSGCTGSERLQQAQVLMEFMQDAEKLISGKNPVILGGDLNTDLNVTDNHPVYDLITGQGFIDSYAETHTDCPDCCLGNDLSGCTFAVPGNPFALDLFTHLPEGPQRIDYIFVNGLDVEDSEVVFNSPTNGNWVSDHSGVLSSLKIVPKP